MSNTMAPCLTIATCIHRLPTETLILIFLLHADSSSRFIPQVHHFRGELENLANLRLLTLSQVSRWHAAVLETPTLWTNIELDCVLWRTASSLERIVALLAATLRRSRDLPLILQITADGNIPLHPRIFQLLASHSRRWSALTMFCDVSGICFSALEGRLPMPKRLQLTSLRVSPPNPFSYLKGVPALRRLHVTSVLLDGISRGTLQNLVECGCEATSASHIARCISLLSQLPTTTSTFELLVDCNTTSTDASHKIDLHIAPQTSTISSLALALGTGHPQHSLDILAQILGSLTLPALREIQFECVHYPPGILEWPHGQFVALSERSGFQHTLKTLNVAQVHISEPILLKLLSMLPALEELEIADKRKVDGKGADVVLISDTLLRALACAPRGPDACPVTLLIPHLCILRCASRLQ
ncbi:hypothetical protein B0H16DRAFT_1879799 [Mycena metata]|uniref:F-box domain-containing protein n=1 Tax=Mycena metata TaxID=1033252 RepID=A0AAD7NUA6_9AGAR|nr:hypothetical protein B0H16DRAFT_1879799 [Mycena metata]